MHTLLYNILYFVIFINTSFYIYKIKIYININKCIDMYSNKSYFGAGNIWVIIKLEHISGVLKREICFVWIFILYQSI